MSKKIEGLSPREFEIVCCLTLNMSNSRIASTLGISKETVKRHISTCCDKTGMDDRVALVMYCYRKYLRSTSHGR